jgi:hypothetical protein
LSACNILYVFYYKDRAYESNNTRKFKFYDIIKVFIFGLKDNSLRDIIIKAKALKNKTFFVVYIAIKINLNLDIILSILRKLLRLLRPRLFSTESVVVKKELILTPFLLLIFEVEPLSS